MVKEIRIPFEDKEHETLVKKKEESGLNWHDFILKLIEEEDETKN